MQADPIQSSIEQFKRVESYSVTLRSYTKSSMEEIKYYYKKPGFVRMDFVEPHNGALLIYDPSTKRVRLKPFSFLKSFIITLKPENPILKSSKSHTVDNSDIGALLRNVKKLQSKGETNLLREEELNGRDCFVVEVEGERSFTVSDINRYIIWFDKDIFLPVKVETHDKTGKLIERVLMDDLKTNISFPDGFFKL